MKKFIIGFALLVMVGCSGAPALEVDTFKIVTTIAPLYSLTANLVEGAENVEIVNLVPPNSSVHSFALTPEAAKQLSEADLIIMNGIGLETFLDDALTDLDAPILDASDGLQVRSLEDGFDPHVWLSPYNAKRQSISIWKKLMALNPENSGFYQVNLAHLSVALDDLNAEVQSGLDALEIGPYVVFHDAYHYFDENFGLSPVAFLEEFPGKEPSPEYLAEVIDLIESNNVKVVFTEPQFSPKLVETLSEDYNLSVYELDPLGRNVSIDGYFELLRSNLEAFQMAFKK